MREDLDEGKAQNLDLLIKCPWPAGGKKSCLFCALTALHHLQTVLLPLSKMLTHSHPSPRGGQPCAL